MGILTLERLAPSGRLAAAFRARTSENAPSTHLGEYRSNSQGATYGCAPRRPRRGEDPETESRIRYTAFQTHQRGGWVLGEDRNTNANTNGPIRVLLADDQTLFREGLAGILASYGGMEVIAEVPNDAEALRLVGELSPDVLIMQVQMPFQRALQTLKAMRSFADPPKVVIVTMFESPRYVRGLTGVGASAYLLKTSSSEHLVAAVRAAVLDPSSENAVVGMPRQMLEGTEEGVESVLSARELEILLLSARGLSNHQIASSLNLSEATVKRHLANIYPKMGVGSRGEAAREALMRDWITIEEVTERPPGEGG